MGRLTITCENCGGKYPDTSDGHAPDYVHTCPPPRDLDVLAAPAQGSAAPQPKRWTRLRALLVRILDWIEGKL